jgi:hypothetical protein
MTINLFQTPEYRALMQSHIFGTIEYLFNKDQEFALACEVKTITFMPELPTEILESFNETVLFILSGYTFESAQLEEGQFSFEAGFGPDNFGSTVSIPLLSIQQILIGGDTPIMINHAKADLNEEKVEEKESDSQKALKSSSMEALLKNPENQRLLKGKK